MAPLMLEKYELYLRPGEQDTHWPLKMFVSDGRRDRSDFSQACRDLKSRKRQRRRRWREVTQRPESDDDDSNQGDVNDASSSQ